MPTEAQHQLATSQIAPTIVQSEIRAMTVECAALPNGINMAQGVCDTDPPHPVVAAAIKAIQDGFNIYTRLNGIDSLRGAIAARLAERDGWAVNPDTEVLVTSGTTGGLHAACLALLNPGDEVILFEPYYGYHVSTLLSMRLTPVVVPLEGRDWQLDPARLAAAITPRTRAIIVNTPSNPAGKVFTRAELEGIAAVAIRENLFVFTDEIYEYFVYDGAEHISLGKLPGMAERTITMSGFSKTFSVTGWRLGYLIADSKWLPAISYFHDLIYVCAPSPLQHGAAAGLLALPPTFYSDLALEYQQKRDLFCSALTDAGLTPHIPNGAYYVLADSSRIPGATAKIKARTLLRETGIATVAGTAFLSGGAGEDLLRFCYAKKDADLAEAARRLRALA